jgi:hypothetical protein
LHHQVQQMAWSFHRFWRAADVYADAKLLAHCWTVSYALAPKPSAHPRARWPWPCRR